MQGPSIEKKEIYMCKYKHKDACLQMTDILTEVLKDHVGPNM